MKLGIDYTIEDGKRVMTREYLLKRGKCCHHNCKNCPWNEKNKTLDKKQIDK